MPDTDKNSSVIAAAIVLFVMVVVGVIGVAVVVILLGRQASQSGNQSLSEAEIFARILASNPSNMVSSSANLTAGGALPLSAQATRNYATDATVSAEAGESKLALPLIYPGPRTGDNYTFSQTTNRPGPAISECAVYSGILTAARKFENYSYYDQSGKYSYKSLSYDANGNVLSFSLSNNAGKDLVRYEYAGGNYAVKITKENYTYLAADSQGATTDVAAPQPAQAPSSAGGGVDASPERSELPAVAPAPDEASIRNNGDVINRFGSEAKLLGKETINGTEAYVVQWSYETSCDPAISPMPLAVDGNSSSRRENLIKPNNNNLKKIVLKAWADAKTFELIHQETYLGSATKDRLIYENDQRFETKKVDFSQVAKNFEFNLQVSVREIDAQVARKAAQEKYAREFAKFLTDNKLVALQPINTLKLQHLYSSKVNMPNIYSYFNDRDYYPMGTKGDEQMRALRASLSYLPPSDIEGTPLLTTSYYQSTRENYQQLNIDVLSLQRDKSKLNSRYAFPSGAGQSTKVAIQIDGKSVAATKYSYGPYPSVTNPGKPTDQVDRPSNGSGGTTDATGAAGSTGSTGSNGTGETSVAPDPGFRAPECSDPINSNLCNTNIILVFDYAGFTYVVNATISARSTVLPGFRSLAAANPAALKILTDALPKL